MGFFDKLKAGLQKTKQLLQTDLRDLFRSGEILTEARLEEFEARLLRTDLGVASSGKIVGDLRTAYLGRTVQLDELWGTVRQSIRELLTGGNAQSWNPDTPLAPLQLSTTGPTVILVAGVNGVGKTTSIAKLSKLLISQGKTVLLGAGDTFRAAAVEQLTLWSQRLGCGIVTKASGSDPAAVAFAACDEALAQRVDVLIIDTAGRLHNQSNLMKELDKVRRVIDKKIPGAPHESLLVIDATTGQNGLAQAKSFAEAATCTGIILTKLDGTAKGGVTVAIRQQMGIPVKYIGVGEQVDDFQVFNPEKFVDALFDGGAG